MVQKATVKDAPAIAKMAIKMWPNHTINALTKEFQNILADSESIVFMLSVDGQVVGFAQCQLRHDYVEGTDSSPVGYLEGIFVERNYRHSGNAKKLLVKCEEWAREKGCTEFASDCQLENSESLAFHLKMGFDEANRIICFVKPL